MANWSLPTLTDLYTNFLSYLKERDDDAARMNDSRVAAASNIPDYSKRWNDSAKRFENWLSAQWSALVLSVSGGGTGASTPADARTNLGVYSTAQVDAAIASGLAHTTVVGNLASITYLTNPSTWYNGPSVSLSAGTWLVIGNLYMYSGPIVPGQPSSWDFAIKSSSTTYQSAAHYIYATGTMQFFMVPMTTVVTLGATTTIYAAAYRFQEGGGSYIRTTSTGSTLVAVKIG